VKIIWNRNRWLREHGAGYIVVGSGQFFPTTEKKLQRDLERFRKRVNELMEELS
jgi:hypothetical protein